MTEFDDWNQKIIAEFRANEGSVESFGGKRLVILHAIGAKTGKVTESPVAFFPQDDGSLIVVASAAGRPNNPAWYHNLKANPLLEIEKGAEGGVETFPVTAAEITGAERDAKWDEIVAVAPGFGDYQKQTTRVIPLFRLTPNAA